MVERDNVGGDEDPDRPDRRTRVEGPWNKDCRLRSVPSLVEQNLREGTWDVSGGCTGTIPTRTIRVK